MRGVPDVVRMEMQHGLQCRQQEARAQMSPAIFGQVTRWITTLGVSSVLEQSDAFWTQAASDRFRPGQWLYRQPELRAQIEQLRPSGAPIRERTSDASLQQRLRTALDDNQNLRQANRDLKHELALAHGSQRALPHSPAPQLTSTGRPTCLIR